MRMNKVCRSMLKSTTQLFSSSTSTSSFLKSSPRPQVSTWRTVVTKIASIPQFEKAIREAPAGKQIIVDYNSQSYEAHKLTSSVFEKMSESRGGEEMLFLSVDCDAVPELAAQRGIDTLPTFETIKDGKMTEKVIGTAAIKAATGLAASLTPLMQASRNGDIANVRELLEAGATQTIAEGITALGCASAFGHVEIVQILLENSKEFLNGKYSDGSTPLILATMRSNEDVVRVLIEEPSLDVDAQANGGYTALYIAAHNGLSTAVQMLLNAGANAELAADSGNTPLMDASMNGHSEVVKMLPANGKDANGHTALHKAAYNGFGDVIRALLEHPSLDVNAQDNDGFTPLVMAASMGHLEVVSALLAHSSISVNAAHTDSGATALHYAAERGNHEVVRALVAHPSLEVDTKCKEGKTALSAAMKTEQESVVKTLLEAGANAEDASVKTKTTPQ